MIIFAWIGITALILGYLAIGVSTSLLLMDASGWWVPLARLGTILLWPLLIVILILIRGFWVVWEFLTG